MSKRKKKETLLRHAAKGHRVSLIRDIPGAHCVHGYVLACSTELVLIHMIGDFHLDGYQILPLSDLNSVSHNATDRSFERILALEGVYEQVGVDTVIDLQSWPSAFLSLQSLGENVIVEEEDPDLDRFLIGRITQVKKKSMSIRHFDSKGRWVDSEFRCRYKNITSVTFRCEYVNVFSRHLKEEKQNSSRC